LALAVVGLVVLAGVGFVGWNIGRGTSIGSVTSLKTPQSPAQAMDPTSIAAKVSPGLVDVNTMLGFQNSEAAGTGIVLTSSGEVLTNNHVVEGATQIQVTDIGDGQTYRADVVGYDSSQDIAVLQLQGASGLTTATTGNSSQTAVGDQIIGIGNAGGVGGAPDVAPGTVTALNQSITATDQSGGSAEKLAGLIQVNANIQPGDSGGSLVNTAGQVIGVDTAASADQRQFSGLGSGGRGSLGQNAPAQGFAIPINQALSIAQQIVSNKSSATVHIGGTPMMGVSVAASSGQGAGTGIGGQGAAQQVSGAMVAAAVPDDPAAQAGLSAGDVITSVDGQTVDSPTALTNLMDQHHPGDKVQVGWLDQAQQQHTATVQLVTGPVG
jgi:S1-C subfamily serine protease